MNSEQQDRFHVAMRRLGRARTTWEGRCVALDGLKSELVRARRLGHEADIPEIEKKIRRKELAVQASVDEIATLEDDVYAGGWAPRRRTTLEGNQALRRMHQ